MTTDQTIQEILRITMQRLSKSGTSNVTKKHILKVLFLVKESLPDDNPIKHDLAYYWYKEGPYSEVVCASFDQMIDSGLVKEHITTQSQTYSLVPEHSLRPVTSIVDLDVIKRKIYQVVHENPNTYSAVSRTYEMAPFRWYTTYNLELKPQFEMYCKNILAGREGTHTDNDVLERLEDAVLDYPTTPEFMKHRMVFMDFSKTVNAFVWQGTQHVSEYMVKRLSEICVDVWDVFAYGVRIHKHDPYYDNRVEDWIKMYDEKLDELECEVFKYMDQFGDVSVNEPDLDPEIEDMAIHPENYTFTPLLFDVVKGR